ncbi:hypothetical protein C8J56DRAFT_821765 [Mycena floridula]|nr:hypothetical protein C8J56DRAFT_821765 [Mycena floridula]
MLFLQSTFIFLSYYAVVEAGSANKGDPCTQGNNRLQAGTYQFYSDCNSVTFCAANNTCVPKGCRKDDFPFGYAQDSDRIPDKCDRGQFCPDEADVCQDWIPVGQPCQLNRDDQCLAPPNFQELADDSNRGLNFNGSVCLNNQCYWANVTENDPCVVENTAYIGYGGDGEFIDIVSRGNCRLGLYCDAQTTTCKANKLLGDACDADKECDSWNCLNTAVCGPPADEPRELGTWVYAIVGIAIIGGMLATLIGLYFLHRRHRDHERAKRAQYWREQNAFHQNLLQMRDTARASILSLPGHQSNLSDGGMSDESHAPMLQNAAPKASGLRYTADDASSIDESLMMQPQMRADGRF